MFPRNKQFWWPGSPDEAASMLLRMQWAKQKRDLVRAASITIGMFPFLWELWLWEVRGISIAGWIALGSFAAMLFLALSDNIHEAILRMPITDNHLLEFERQIKGYEAAGLWPPT